MSKKLSQCRSGEDFSDYLDHADDCEELRDTGGHRVFRLPDGNRLPIPRHRHEMGRGLRAKIVKMMMAAGLGVFVGVQAMHLLLFYKVV